MLLRLRNLFAGLWLTFMVALGACAQSSVVIVSSDDGAAYAEAAQALVQELERGGVSRFSIRRINASEWRDARPQAPRLYVTLGAEAADLLARFVPGAPVLCALLPRNSFEAILLRTGRKVSSQLSALFLDQPAQRQFQLIRLAFPSARRVGVLWGPDQAKDGGEWRTQAQAAGFQLVDAEVGTEDLLFPALKQVLDGTDLLLAVPSPQVYNSRTIQNILLTSFRANVPMMAFSPAYVRAGALLAVYVTPSQVGVQAAHLARAVLEGKTLPASGVYSNDFHISVNEHVAHSLDLSLDEQDLSRRLRQREARP
ncbi:MAG: ABC transporter substrate binding protein [Comamonadaceae bacterium]